MLDIKKINNSVVVVSDDNIFYPNDNTNSYPLNSLMVVVDESDMAVFKSAANGDVLFSALIEDLTINGSKTSKDTIFNDLDGVISAPQDGGGGGTVDAYTKAESDAKYGTKAEQESLRGDVENALGEIAALGYDKADKSELAKYETIEAHNADIDKKQDKLIAGDGIGIYGNTISLRDEIYSNNYDKYFTIEALGKGYIKFNKDEYSYFTYPTIYYSLNDGEWTEAVWAGIYDYSQQINVVKGDKLRLKANCDHAYYLPNTTEPLIRCDLNCKFYGNINSMYAGDNFTENINSYENMFYGWFQGAYVVDASNLVIPYKYYKSYACNFMFTYCIELVYAPVLKDINFESNRNYDTFNSMFKDCRELKSVEVNLTTDNFDNDNFSNFVNGCSNLNRIKFIAKRNDGNLLNINEFTRGVASTGTFVKTKGAEWSIGVNGIPNGWTVEEYEDSPYATENFVKNYTYDKQTIDNKIAAGGGGGDLSDYYTKEEADARFEPKKIDYEKEYFTIEALEDGNVEINFDNVHIFKYSLNGGEWKAPNSFNEIIQVKNGDKLRLKNNRDSGYDGTLFNTLPRCNVYGNINSLFAEDDFLTNVNIYENHIKSFFSNKQVVDASNLILPYKELIDQCYYQMFFGCQSLVKAPKLPATTLAKSCYYYMFKGCGSLEKAPELPATTLASNCYTQMFYSCKSLKESPVLPAKILMGSCYTNMFAYCNNLEKVVCLAEEIGSHTGSWLRDTSTSGTFVKAKGVEWTSGTSGIPNGWTVEEYDDGSIDLSNYPTKQEVNQTYLQKNGEYVKKVTANGGSINFEKGDGTPDIVNFKTIGGQSIFGMDDIGNATTSKSGLMSSDDKKKLNATAKVYMCSQGEYDSMPTHDNDTLYLIIEQPEYL